MDSYSNGFDFDEVVNRKEQNSKKWIDWSGIGINKVIPDVLPMWIADMEFKCAPQILEALKKPIEWGVIGYDSMYEQYYDSFIAWQKKRNNWDIRAEWLVPVPGVVQGLAAVIRKFTQEHEGILIQPPVYYPFFMVINENNRTVVENNLVYTQDGYTIDFDDLDKKLSKAKMIILCNPHNPIGRVWKRDELQRIGELCIKHDILIIADEIHSDLILSGHKHTPIAALSEELLNRTITLCAPSKTFNVAGLMQSVAIIKNPALRDSFIHGLKGMGIMHMNSFAIAGFSAAYQYGEAWLDAALAYIESNVDFVVNFVKQTLPAVKTYKIESTFLMWLDMTAVSDDSTVIDDALLHTGKILLDPGIVFGKSGDRFYRINVACPRSMMEDAMNRIATAVHAVEKQ